MNNSMISDIQVNTMEQGKTVLHVAIETSRLEILKVILRYNPDMSMKVGREGGREGGREAKVFIIYVYRYMYMVHAIYILCCILQDSDGNFSLHTCAYQ